MEDLCNELIYEIFEYLDHFHVYEAFFHLNIRFRYLLTHSNSPIKIDLSSLSKSAWKRYHADLIENNMDRITTLRVCNPCMYDAVLSSLKKLLPFNRIENLIVNNIECFRLDNLLSQLSSSSSLSSLIITTVDNIQDKAKIYQKIFRLPALKYCKLSLSGWRSSSSLPNSGDECSPIEYLIITNSIYMHELDSLLSYVPQLRRLSLYLSESNSSMQTQGYSFVSNQLTHIDLRIEYVQFGAFAELVKKFPTTIEVMCLTLTGYIRSEPTYTDANKWEQLIASYLPKLRIFDIQCDFSIYTDNFLLNMEEQLNRFLTPFWITRQWFFAYRSSSNNNGKHVLFYSTNFYRYCG